MSGNSGNIRKVLANTRLRATGFAGGPFVFLVISALFVHLHVRIMVRAAIALITHLLVDLLRRNGKFPYTGHSRQDGDRHQGY